jgi:acyl-CoA synthetase (NDP forming)
MDEALSLSLLSDYGIATPRSSVVDSLQDVRAAARAIGFPVALKTAQPGILHKSDRDGVRLGLSENALDAAYLDLSERLGPRALVAEMAPSGAEVAFGLIRDPQFGPYVMMASGGIWIEIIKDRVLALPPVSLEEAANMAVRLKIAPLFAGARGRPKLDFDTLVESFARFSMLAADLGDLIEEMDVNPLLVSPRGATAVDAVIRTSAEAAGTTPRRI